MNQPKILAPAGDKNSFLAAIAAGTDAIYCGLKLFSARMEAGNFSIEELARLSKLARAKGIEVYVAFNSTIKETEQQKVYNLIKKLVRYVSFQALIVQDAGILPIAKSAGFRGEFHLSTLGNLSFPEGLKSAAKMGFTKVVLPREFTIDEIKAMASATPTGTDLEVFVHGALCYSVSGRCYWSSWFGGKSSLRGRCVQPCRRMYEQKGAKKRSFSCLDFSVDVLSKVLKTIPQVTTWKIEGRKKSPHYVYYTVKAYRTFRDKPEQKKEAAAFLEYAMGREFTHYNLLTQRRKNPLDHGSETASGLFAGRIKNPPSPYFITREALIPGDLIRIGYEDDDFHLIQKVTRAVPKRGKFYLAKRSKQKAKKGTPVYLIDRRGPELSPLLNDLEQQLSVIEKVNVDPSKGSYFLPGKTKKPNVAHRLKNIDMIVSRKQKPSIEGKLQKGVWASFKDYRVTTRSQDWIWTDPALFPDDEKKLEVFISKILRKGVKNFVLNAPWHITFFSKPEKLNIWAGPFCNISNSSMLFQLENLGYKGAIVSPELDKNSFVKLAEKSPLSLGAVVFGNWPLGISRVLSPELKVSHPFISPRGEFGWVSRFNQNFFVYPNWHLDITSKISILKKAGYSMFVTIEENIPKNVKMKNRPGLWNWDLKLL